MGVDPGDDDGDQGRDQKPRLFAGYHDFLKLRPVLTRDQEEEIGVELIRARVSYWCAVLRRTLPSHRKRIVQLVMSDRRIRQDAAKVSDALAPLDQRRTARAVRSAAEILANVDSPCAVAHEISASMRDREVVDTRKRLRDVCALMVEHNLRLVIHHVIKRRNSPRDMEDAVSDGALGLLRAVELFDPRRGLRFSTYAVHWIRHGLLRGMQEHGRTVRVPSHALATAVKIKKAYAQLFAELGRDPTDDEIATKAKIPGRSLALGRLALSQRPVALEDPEDPGSYRTVGDALISTFADAETALLDQERHAFLDQALRDFGPPRYRMILFQRFGIGCEPRTLESVGQELGISRERVRQLEVEALSRLRRRIEQVSSRAG